MTSRALLGCAITATLFAQTAPSETDPLGRHTPRGAVLGFLRAAHGGNYGLAGQYLESARGRQAVSDLATVVDHADSVRLDSISDEAEGDLRDGLAPDLERIGAVEVDAGSTDLLLRRVTRGAVPVWLFAAETIARAPGLSERIGASPIERLVPDSMKGRTVAGIPIWLIAALSAAAALAAGVGWLLAMLVLWMAGLVSRRTSTSLDDSMVQILNGPLRLFLTVLLFHAGTLFIGLPLLARQWLIQVEIVIGVVAVCWLLLRSVDLASAEARGLLVRTQRAAAISMIPLGRRIAKVTVLVLAFLAILDNAGFDLKAILTGLGVGGIAIALAAQKTLENVFGGVALVVDQPVRVGDFCKFGDSIGTVEDVGLRSTRIRTLDRTVISVPNSSFSTMNIENFAPREKVWFHPVLRLRMDTSVGQLRDVLAGIRALLQEHSKMEPGARIRMVGFSADALSLEVFGYVATANYDEFLVIQEELLMRMMEIIERAGTSLAVPTQTIFVGRDLTNEKKRRPAQE